MKILRRLVSIVLMLLLIPLIIIGIIITPLVCLMYKDTSIPYSYKDLVVTITGSYEDLLTLLKTGEPI